MERLEEHITTIKQLVDELKHHSPEVLAPARREKGSSKHRIPMLALGVSAGLPTASDDTIEREIDLADMLLYISELEERLQTAEKTITENTVEVEMVGDKF